MSKSTVGVDFFRTEKANEASGSHLETPSDPRRTLQGIMSRINRHLLMAIMASSSTNGRSEVKPTENDVYQDPGMMSLPANPKLCSALPIYNPISRFDENQTETLPLTIFYNGTVTVFNLPPQKAEMVMKFAENGNIVTADPKFAVVSGNDEGQLLEKLKGDLPIARKMSLLRFLEKRKGRYFLSFYNPAYVRRIMLWRLTCSRHQLDT